jgi:hypothetical protein
MRCSAGLLLFTLFPVAAVAQGTGRTAGIILEIPATARTLGLGGAYAAVVGDESSVWGNPAGMAPIRRVALGMSWERSLFGTTYTSAAGAMRVGRFTIGAGAALLDFGGDSVLVPDPLDPDVGVPTGGAITAYQAMAVGALAYRRGMMSAGFSVKALREHISSGVPDRYTAHGVTGDVGFAIAVFDIMALGVTVQNLAGRMRGSDGDRLTMPRTTRAGFTLNFIDPQGTARLMTTTDFVAPPGGDSYWAFGVEAGVITRDVGATGRLGFPLGRAASDRAGLVYGGTLQVRFFRVDWSYQPYDALGTSSHRFGARWVL